MLTLQQTYPRILPYKNRIWNSVTYEVNHTRTSIERIDYGFFEWLGDIGGIQGIFFSFLGPLVVFLLVGNGSTIAIASHVTDLIEEGTDDGAPEGSSVFNNCCLMLRLKLTCGLSQLLCACCCRDSQVDRRIRKGQQMVEKELDVSFLL